MDRTLAFNFVGRDKSLGKTLGSLEKKSNSLKNHMGAVAGAFVGGAAAASVITFGKHSISAFADATRAAISLRRVIGGTIEDASRLGFAAKESGVSQESLAKSLRILSKNLNSLKTPSAAHAKLTKELGVAYRDATGHILPMAKLLPAIADRFKNMADGPEKTALALQLFGKAGTDMLPMLNRGAAGIRELTAESDKFGNTITGKDAAALKEYTQAHRTFSAAMDGVKISLGRELFPVMAQWARFLSDNAPQINAWARQYMPEIGQAALTVARVMKDDLLPPIVSVFKFLDEHHGTVKVATELLIGYKVATMGAAIWSKSLAFWAPKAALGMAGVGTAGGTAAAGVGAAGAGGLAGALAGLTLIDVAGWGAAAVGVFNRISAVVKGLRGDIGPLLHLSEFGLGDKPDPGKGKSTQQLIDGMSPAERARFYSWYPQYRPKVGAAANPKLSPTRSPDGPVRARAQGGNIEARTPYMVGENGPELRTFSRAGSILSAGKTRRYLDVNDKARLDASQIVDNRARFGLLFSTPTAPRSRSAYAPAGMRDYIIHTDVILDGKKIATTVTRRQNGRAGRGHLNPGQM